MNRKITRHILHFVEGKKGGGVSDWDWGDGGMEVGGAGESGLAHVTLMASLKLSKRFSNTIIVLSLRASGELR